MKRNPSLAAVRQRLAPGRLSQSGFLGPDERPLAEIIAADLAEIESLGLQPADLAELLDELHLAADAGLETPQSACGGRATVAVIEGMGRLPCPFGCGFRTHKATVQVKAGDVELTFTPMHAHLLREHGFLQGRGSDFRLEPQALAALYRACRRAAM